MNMCGAAAPPQASRRAARARRSVSKSVRYFLPRAGTSPRVRARFFELLDTDAQMRPHTTQTLLDGEKGPQIAGGESLRQTSDINRNVAKGGTENGVRN